MVQTLLKKEARLGRLLLDQFDLKWDSKMMEKSKNDPLYISIHSPKWDPRSETSNQKWNDRTRTLIHVCVPILAFQIVKEFWKNTMQNKCSDLNVIWLPDSFLK